MKKCILGIAVTFVTLILIGCTGTSTTNSALTTDVSGSYLSPGAVYAGLTLGGLQSGQAGIVGTISISTVCAAASVNISLKSGQSMVYQTSAPSGASFQMPAAAGAYTLVLSTNASAACTSQQSVTLETGQWLTETLTLSPSTTSTTGNANNYGNSTGYPTGIPCAGWNGYSCTGSYYPGSGGGYVGKPNIYFSGAAGTQISVKLRSSDSATLLSTIPIYGADGWSGVLNTNGGVTSHGVNYPYFYYDERFDPSPLQSSEAFCSTHQEILQKMVIYLNEAGFKANEVKDFTDYWVTRLPSASNYCVYPQEHHDILSSTDLDIIPAPSKMTRVWFFVVVQQNGMKVGFGSTYKKFARKFAMNPSIKAEPRFFAAKREKRFPYRSLASGGLEVREWGVGFLADTPNTK